MKNVRPFTSYGIFASKREAQDAQRTIKHAYETKIIRTDDGRFRVIFRDRNR